ncbi:MAG TPA: peptide-methionine (R)-S-oxide reductase MsrB [Saprospiraceae bacterium]|nr:peptide-methionine (R)-S-oxide reductase MsrB [Saprospiraceae bacterium]
MQRLILALVLIICFAMNACLQSTDRKQVVMTQDEVKLFVDRHSDTIHPVLKSEAQWKSELDPMTYHVMREKGTERAFTGAYDHNKAPGTYYCKACNLSLFSSKAKFDSGTGWPSFYQPLDKTHVLEETDNAYGWPRTEVLCSRCGGHLGHVFDDGPKPTGLRYCMNSVALNFIPE